MNSWCIKRHQFHTKLFQSLIWNKCGISGMKNTYFTCFFELSCRLAPCRPKNTWLCISVTIPLLSLFIHQFIYWMICIVPCAIPRVAHGPVFVTWYFMSHPCAYIIQENLCYCMSCLVTVCSPVPPKRSTCKCEPPPPSTHSHWSIEDVVRSVLQELWHIASIADTVINNNNHLMGCIQYKDGFYSCIFQPISTSSAQA